MFLFSSEEEGSSEENVNMESQAGPGGAALTLVEDDTTHNALQHTCPGTIMNSY